MRRHALALTLALGTITALSTSPRLGTLARADDAADAKAADDYKALQDWLAGETPKTAKEKEALRTELTKRCRAFLKDHPDSGTPTLSIRDTLAEVFYNSKKFSDALPLWEALLKAPDDVFVMKGRIGTVKCLIQTDKKAARARLDGYLKDFPTEPGLVAEDKYLKENPGGAGTKEMAVGDTPLEITSKTAGGEDFTLSKLKGKVVVLEFWATWCPSCKKEVTGLKKVYSDYHAKGLEVIGVNAREKTPAEAPAFLKKESVPWPQLLADGPKITLAYNVKNLPRIVLIDKDGHIAAFDRFGDSLGRAVKALLDGKPVPDEKPTATEADGEGKGEGMDGGEKDGEK